MATFHEGEGDATEKKGGKENKEEESREENNVQIDFLKIVKNTNKPVIAY